MEVQMMVGYRQIDKLVVLDVVIVDKVQMHHLLQCSTKDGWMLLQVNRLFFTLFIIFHIIINNKYFLQSH